MTLAMCAGRRLVLTNLLQGDAQNEQKCSQGTGDTGSCPVVSTRLGQLRRRRRAGVRGRR